MSILTKIFVVLVTVLAIAMVPLMVAYVENTQGIQERLQTVQADRAAAVARASFLERRNQEIQNKYSDALAEKVAAQAEVENRLVSRLGDLKELQTENVRLAQQLAGKDATIARLSATGEWNNRIIEALRQDEDEAQDRALEAQQTLVERTGQVQELRTNLELMNENLRLVQEQLADSKQRIANLQERLEAAPDAEATPSRVAAAPEVPIRGLVTSVDELAGGETLVAINVGSNDNVKAGMNFIIHRGGQYVATMEVVKVDQQRAAGRVTLKEGRIEPNLQVTTPLRGF